MLANLVRGQLLNNLTLLRSSPALRISHSLDAMTLESLARVITSFAAVLSQSDQHITAGHTTSIGTDNAVDVSRYRWHIGHHLFHLMMLGLEWVLRQSLHDSTVVALLPAVTHAHQLLIGSGSALRYTGDSMSAESYRILRAEFPEGGFSGILNAEHRTMKAALVAFEHRLEELCLDDLEGPFLHLKQVLENAKMLSIQGHVHTAVCSRLVPERTSLLGKDVLGLSSPEHKDRVVPSLTIADYDSFFEIERDPHYSWLAYSNGLLTTLHLLIDDLFQNSALPGGDLVFLMKSMNTLVSLQRRQAVTEIRK